MEDMTDSEKIEDYEGIREFVADTINTRNIKHGPPSGGTEPLEAWAFRQIVKRFFQDLDA